MTTNPAASTTCLSNRSTFPNVLFDLIAKNLTQSKIATLAAVSAVMRLRTDTTRSKLPHLDISHKPGRIEMTHRDWDNAFKIYRASPSIELGGYQAVSIKMRDSLVAALKERTMRKLVVATATALEYQRGQGSPWDPILRALNHALLNRPTASPLELLDLTGASANDPHLLRSVCFLTVHCPQLKILRLPPHPEPDYRERGMDLVPYLPRSLELLGPHWAPLDDALITEIATRFEPENIQGCQLAFDKDHSSSTAEKRGELLRFLKLSQMATIELQGKRNYHDRSRWPAEIEEKHKLISAEMIETIATQLKENKKLEVLNLTGLLPSEDLVPSLIRLIDSIESDQLRELTLLTNLDAIPDLTYIEEALRQKLPNWKKIVKIQINHLTLDLLQPPIHAANRAASRLLDRVPDLFQAAQGHEAERQQAMNRLFLNCYPQQQEICDQILALDLIPIPTIFAHYAQVHNTLLPNQQIRPDQVLSHFHTFADGNQNLNWNHPGQLIRLLENLSQREKQQVELAISRQIRSEQDAEYGQKMGASPK